MNCEGLVYIGENLVYLSGIKSFIKSVNKNDALIIASFNKQDQSFLNYKERLQIEIMFRAMKPSVFNMEDTHLTDLERISKLIAMIAMAFVWVYRIGVDKHENIK
jgi:predicted HAD superfamily phosphohydrolase YqeG